MYSHHYTTQNNTSDRRLRLARNEIAIAVHVVAIGQDKPSPVDHLSPNGKNSLELPFKTNPCTNTDTSFHRLPHSSGSAFLGWLRFLQESSKNLA